MSVGRNRIQCLKCKDIIESTFRHDFKWCKCGAVAVDGGKDYLKRCGEWCSWKELSESEEETNVENKPKNKSKGKQKDLHKGKTKT